MSRISKNHIEFMKHFIDDTNTLTSKLLKDQQVKYGVSTEQSNKIDQRLKYIVLTEKGRQYTEENNEIISQIVNDMVKDLSSKDIEKALSVLYIIDERVKHFNAKVK